MELHDVIEQARNLDPVWVYITLFLAAFIEYILPPLPGDTVVVGGAVLASAWGWEPWGIFGVVTLGAVLGAALDFGLGSWLRGRHRLEDLQGRKRLIVTDIVERMRRHGPVYLMLNRFLPGIRAFFFLAAGLAGLRFRAVLFYATLSALAWNALLLGIGFALGQNTEAVDTLFRAYTWVMWVAVSLGLGAWMWLLVIKRRGKMGERDGPKEVDGDAHPKDDLDPPGQGPPSDG